MPGPDLLDLVPERAAAEAGRYESKARFEFPRFKSGPGRIFGSLLRASETIKINLDEVGTAAWDLMDGRRSVRRIAEVVADRFGDEAQPVEQRLTALFQIMHRNGLIRFRHPDFGGRRL